MKKPVPKLLIFDADGTLRWTTVEGQPCPNGPDEWRLMPNVREILSAIPWEEEGYRIGVASNQGGVAAGYLSQEVAYQLLVDMLVEAIGYLPSESYIELCTCPATVDCTCRKPSPGMLVRILERSGTPAVNALYVGDLEKDREAAERAGIDFMWAKDFFGLPDPC